MDNQQKNIRNIKKAFQDMLQNYKLDSRYTATVIQTSWEKLMGKPIASRTSKISLYNKKLKVTITSAPLKNELNMSKSKILELLEKEFGKGVIEEIVFI